MFRVVLFAMSENYKQPKCPSTIKWTCEIWNITTIEYNSIIIRNKLLLCNNLNKSLYKTKGIMLSENSYFILKTT